jgi:hypothetical protein
MRYIFFTLSFFIPVSIHSQTLADANRLYAAGKYAAAADAYRHLYRFDREAECFRRLLSTTMKSKKKTPQQAAVVDSLNGQLNRAEDLTRMLSRCENIRIIDSVAIEKDRFLNAYILSENAGTLEKTKNLTVYENQLKNRRFYGKTDGKNLCRLYMQVKLQEEWSEEMPLNIPTDSLSDETYPFVMPDGLTVYYASTGNGSIGGYDLFVSRYNTDNGAYLTPNHLGMPFNSTANDYMMAVDELAGVGYFATDRFQPEDRVTVYTFIPNDEPVFVESEDFEVLSARAKISSFRDTWPQGANYQDFLQKIKQTAQNRQQETTKDFTFIINGNAVYHTLSDFHDDGAKQAFLRAQALQEQIAALENQLDAQRKDYAESSDSRKQALKSPILENESRLEALEEECGEMVLEARNREIKLKTKR